MTLENKSILITGGAGFIGSHLIERLIQEQSLNLVVVDNFSLGKESNLEEAKANCTHLKIYHQDASDYQVMEQIMKNEGIQVVFNLAAIPLEASLTYPMHSYEQTVNVTFCLCELARNRKFETLIHFSSSEAYGTSLYTPMDENHPLNPRTPYAASKVASDHLVFSYCQTFGIDASIIRPFNNYGPRQNEGIYAAVIPLTIKRILSGETPVIYGDGEQTRDFLFVTETANAAIKVYNNSQTRGKIINIGSGIETSINTLVRLIAQHLHCDKPIIYQEARPGDVRRHIAGIKLAKGLIGFRTSVNLEEGLKITVDWYQEPGNMKTRTL